MTKGKGVSKAKTPGTQVAIHKPQPPATLDQQIMAAASNPAVDVEKMRALLDLRADVRKEEAKEQFNLAMAEAQAEMRPVEADANNPSTKSKYATLYQVDNRLRPIYSKHGLNISFNTADCPLQDHIRVLAYVSRGLHTREYQHDVAIDAKGARGNDVMNKTHARNSALSYGKRNLLLMIFNVTIKNERGRPTDDDGNAAGGADVINEAQAKELIRLLDEAKADKAKFCETFEIEGVAMLPAAKFEEAKKRIAAYKRRVEEAASGFPGDRK